MRKLPLVGHKEFAHGPRHGCRRQPAAHSPTVSMTAPSSLAAAALMGLEGVVSKRRNAPNRSATSCGGIKTKKAWREANKDRWRFLEQQ